jgi:hypothetical protein
VGALLGPLELGVDRAHHLGQLVLADLDEGLLGGHRGLAAARLGLELNALPQHLLAYLREKTAGDVELDVGLKERQPHLAERPVDDILGQLAHTGELLPRLAKPVGERLEHGFPLRLGVAA